eukprot:Nk52_evm56s1401 gene=Nk52_evmTU56s1401
MYYNSPNLIKPSRETLVRNLCHHMQDYILENNVQIQEQKGNSKKKTIKKKSEPNKQKRKGEAKKRRQMDYEILKEQHAFPHLKGKKTALKLTSTSLLGKNLGEFSTKTMKKKKVRVGADVCNQKIIHAKLLEKIHPGNHFYSTKVIPTDGKKADANSRQKPKTKIIGESKGNLQRKEEFARKEKEPLKAKERALLRLEGYSQGLKDGVKSLGLGGKGEVKCIKALNEIVRKERNFIRRNLVEGPKDGDKAYDPFDFEKPSSILPLSTGSSSNLSYDLKTQFDNMYLQLSDDDVEETKPPNNDSIMKDENRGDNEKGHDDNEEEDRVEEEDNEDEGKKEKDATIEKSLSPVNSGARSPKHALQRQSSSLLEEIQFEVLSEVLPVAELHREFKDIYDPSNQPEPDEIELSLKLVEPSTEGPNSPRIVVEEDLGRDETPKGHLRPGLERQRSSLQEAQFDVLSESFGEDKAREMLSAYEDQVDNEEE